MLLIILIFWFWQLIFHWNIYVICGFKQNLYIYIHTVNIVKFNASRCRLVITQHFPIRMTTSPREFHPYKTATISLTSARLGPSCRCALVGSTVCRWRSYVRVSDHRALCVHTVVFINQRRRSDVCQTLSSGPGLRRDRSLEPTTRP